MSRYRSQETAQDGPPPTLQTHISRGGDHDGSGDRQRRDTSTDALDPFVRALNLRISDARERVYVRDRGYDLNAAEIRALATIGAFRVVDARDLSPASPDARTGNLGRLRELKLIEFTHPVFRHGHRAALLTLTPEAKALLEHHRAAPDGRAAQEFYVGLAKPREAHHDAQLYGAYRDAATHLQSGGARINRVVLDYELKREYQRFLHANNRGKRDSSGRPDRSPEAIAAWAAEHHLPVEDGHVRFPDVRIEYEHPDGRLDREDLELTTGHYTSRQMAGKRASGFRLVRGASSTRRGGKPFEIDGARKVPR